MDPSLFLSSASIGVFVIGTGLGGLLFVIGWIWLIVMGFKHHIGWGLVVLLVPFLGGLIFGLSKLPGTQTPLILLVIGFILGGGAHVLL